MDAAIDAAAIRDAQVAERLIVGGRFSVGQMKREYSGRAAEELPDLALHICDWAGAVHVELIWAQGRRAQEVHGEVKPVWAMRDVF